MTTTKDTLFGRFSAESKALLWHTPSCAASPLFVRAHAFQTLSFRDAIRSKERETRFFAPTHRVVLLSSFGHIERERLSPKTRAVVFFFRRSKMCPSSSSSSSSSSLSGKKRESLTPIRPNALEAVPPFPRYAGARRRRRRRRRPCRSSRASSLSSFVLL